MQAYRRAPVTSTLILLCVLVYLGMSITGGSTNTANLIRWGANVTPLIHQGQYWRLLSAGFIHIGFQHILLNMVTLYFIGLYIESIMGHWEMMVIYLVSVLSGNIASATFLGNSISAGASTGIFGLFGAFIFLGFAYRDNLVIHQLARQFLILVVLNIAFDLLMPGIDLAGHIGGLIGGFLTAGAIAVPSLGKISLLKRFLSGTILLLLLVLSIWRWLR